MTIVIQAITANTIKRHTLANTGLYSTGALILSKDGVTVYGTDGASLPTLRMSTNLLDTPGSVTWTPLHTFTGEPAITGMVELANGEVIVGTGVASNGGKLWRSTGWASNKATATWSMVLQANTMGGFQSFDPHYNLQQFNNGTNGVMVVSQSGPQTAGGSSNDTTDDTTRAVRAYLSQDFGSTWSVMFNLRDFATARGIQYPSNVHIHGVTYDESWDRIWLCYGDTPGNGKEIAGYGYCEVLYSDDRGSTWNRLVSPTDWANPSGNPQNVWGQFINCMFNSQAIMFSMDAGSLGKSRIVFRKIGYRQLDGGEEITASPDGLNGLMTYANGHYWSGGVDNTSNAAGPTSAYVMASPDLLTWDQITIPVNMVANQARGVLRVLGPNKNGRVLVQLASTPSGAAGASMIGDMTYA